MRRFVFAFIATAACAAWAQSSYHEVASVKQLMAIIHGPQYGAINGMLKAGGPKDEKDWLQVQNNATLLAEGGQLLLLGNRPKDQDVWVKNANSLTDSASAAAKAAEAKDADYWKTAASGIGKSCQGCHSVHRMQQKKQ
jgi:cytochrome c556